jgi:hypothetical protein
MQGDSPTGGYGGTKLLITKKKAIQESSGEKVDVFSFSSSKEYIIDSPAAVLDFTKDSGASFVSQYFDGLQGSQSLTKGGLVVKNEENEILYELVNLQYNYYSSSSTYTYDLFSSFKIDITSIFLSNSKAFLSLFEGGLLVSCRDSAEGSSVLDWEHFDTKSSNLNPGEEQRLISSLEEGTPSTLNIIDSWSDGKTIFSADCLQYSVLGGPRSLGIYSYLSSASQNAGSPEVSDERRSYLYRDNGSGAVAAGGGIVAFSMHD